MKNINISWAVFIVGIFFSLNNIFAQSSPPLIVFGLIADTQYADCESGKTRFYRNSLGKLHERYSLQLIWVISLIEIKKI